ncbi:Protein of uncharacterised function (DUF1672) [Listeria fleischmannii subsp. coloradonensis]|nr:Protein of uncharacterised function (DUF1672) [Listeria fleischmannii subsp. coloradonensis]
MGNSDEKEKKADDGTTPVAEYKGQGFRLVDGDKSKPIVEKNEAEIKKRAIAYMKDTYKTDVKVNNVVPARDAAVVMVEAEEPIEFHTSVIVGLDMQKKELDSLPNVWSEDGLVESAITSGLYVKAYKDEFEQLDTFTKNIAEKYELQGLNQTTIDKTHTSGYEKGCYFVPIGGQSTAVYDAYIKNPNISASEIRNLFLKVDSKFKDVNIVLHFFNTEKGVPKQEKAEKIAEDVRNESGLPKGIYNVTLYDNFIVNRVGQPNGDNVNVENIKK